MVKDVKKHITSKQLSIPTCNLESSQSVQWSCINLTPSPPFTKIQPSCGPWKIKREYFFWDLFQQRASPPKHSGRVDFAHANLPRLVVTVHILDFFYYPKLAIVFFFLELPTKLFLKKNSRPKIFWAGHNFAKLARIFQVFRSQAHSDEKSVRWAQAELDKWRRVWKPRWVGGWGVAGSSHQLPVMFGYILTIIGSSQSIAIYLQQFF